MVCNKALANSIWLLSEVLTSHPEERLCVLHWTFYRLKRCTEWRAEKVHVNILFSSLGGNNGHASLLHVTVCEMSVKMCCFAGLSECAMNTSCSVALKKMEKKKHDRNHTPSGHIMLQWCTICFGNAAKPEASFEWLVWKSIKNFSKQGRQRENGPRCVLGSFPVL